MGFIKEFFAQVPYFWKRFSPYHLLEIFLVFLFVYGLKFGNVKYWLFFVLSIVVFPFFVMGMFSANVKNETTKTITAKPENGDKLITVLNDGSPSEPIDGFKYDDVVYKMPGGCRATVYENVGVKQHSIIGWIIFKLFGRGFNGWNDLFCK